MKSYAFLFWAYNVVWIGLAGYMFFLLARIRKTDRRVSRLERELDGGE